MPSAYAHHKLGVNVKAVLPEELRKIIDEKPDNFELGLHGPDPLFFYKPFKKNPVNAQADDMHNAYASEFFRPAKELYLFRGKRTEDLSYLFGFLCHFALDSEGHPYVYGKQAKSNVSHSEVESAFDRELMLDDGVDPFRRKTTADIRPTEEVYTVAAAYFRINDKAAKKSVKSFKFYSRLMQTKNGFVRGIMDFILKLSGNYDRMHGLLMPKENDDRFLDSNGDLKAALAKATDKAVELIVNYDRFLKDEEALSVKLDRNFE